MKPLNQRNSGSKSADPFGQGRVQRIHRTGGKDRVAETAIPKAITQPVVYQESQPSRLTSRFVAVALVALTLVILVSVVFFWLSPRMATPPASKTSVAQSVTLSEDTEVLTGDSARALVAKALAITDPAQVKNVFRVNDSSPQEVLNFVKSLGKPTKFRDQFSTEKINDTPKVLVIYENDGIKTRRWALLTQDADHAWKVDFESFARKTSIPWDEFLSGKENRIEARLNVRLDTYYNSYFADESQWICYQLTTADLQETLYGYCRIDSPEAKALAMLKDENRRAGQNQAPGQFILELRRPEGAGNRQFEITHVAARGWIKDNPVVDQPFFNAN